MFKSLIKNTGIYFFINLLSQAAVFILLIVMAKFVSSQEIGIYTLSIFVVDFLGAFNMFGLDTVLVRFYHTDNEKKSVLSNSVIIFIFSSIFSVAVLFGASNMILYMVPSLSKILMQNLFLFSALVFTSTAYGFALAHYSALKQIKSFGQISILQTVLFFVLSLLFLNIDLRIGGILYALFISYLISIILFLIKEFKEISFKLFSFKIIKSILHYGVPMMIYSVFGVVVVYIGRIFLDKYTGLLTLGVYSFFLMITLQINGAWATFNRAWTPDIFSKLNKDRENTINNIQKTSFFSSFAYMSFMAILIILYKIGFLGLFLKQEYLSNINIFYILLLGPLFTGIYTACYPLYYYEKKTKLVLLISIILNLFNILLTFILVKSFGQIGAALSFFVISALTAFTFIISFKRSMKIPSKIVEWLFLLFIFMVVAIVLLLKTSSIFIFLVFMICGAIFANKMGDLRVFDFLKNNIQKNGRY